MGSPGIKSCSDEEFIHLVESIGALKTARHLGLTERAVYRRLGNIRKFQPVYTPTQANIDHPDRVCFELKNGSVLIGSDFHIWPGNESTALRAFKKICKDIQPRAIVLNGDVLDFPSISRHPPMGWEGIPMPFEEIECVQDHLSDIEQASPRGSKKIWTLGNHDARFEMRLAAFAKEYKNIKGIHLSDHFNPCWEKGWSTWINDMVVCKHRWKGGIHATHNNTLNSGKTMVTGHLHSQRVTPFTDYNGTRYGIDTGCVADPYHQAFSYAEDNPRNWISGFAVLTFKDGKLLLPELCSVWSKNEVRFQGKIIKI